MFHGNLEAAQCTCRELGTQRKNQSYTRHHRFAVLGMSSRLLHRLKIARYVGNCRDRAVPLSSDPCDNSASIDRNLSASRSTTSRNDFMANRLTYRKRRTVTYIPQNFDTENHSRLQAVSTYTEKKKQRLAAIDKSTSRTASKRR